MHTEWSRWRANLIYQVFFSLGWALLNQLICSLFIELLYLQVWSVQLWDQMKETLWRGRGRGGDREKCWESWNEVAFKSDLKGKQKTEWLIKGERVTPSIRMCPYVRVWQRERASAESGMLWWYCFCDRDQWLAQCVLFAVGLLSQANKMWSSRCLQWHAVHSGRQGFFVFPCPNYGTVNTLPGSRQ